MSRPLVVIAVACCLCAGPAFGQIPLTDLGSISGAWECTGANGIDGVFIAISTSLSTRSEQPIIDWQAVNIRVYHRLAGRQESVGSFSPPTYHWLERNGGHSENQDTTTMTNRHLSINSSIDLDLRFDPTVSRWSGTWSENGKVRDIVLERPHPIAHGDQSPLVGDWEVPSTHGVDHLYVRQSLDGTLVAWRDHSVSGAGTQATHTNWHNGERWEIVGVPNRLRLSSTWPTAPELNYQGRLSGDQESILGEWRSGSFNTRAAKYTRLH